LRVTSVSSGFVRTDFASSMSDPVMRTAIAKKLDEIAIEPDAIARAIAFAIEQPADVDAGDIVVPPTAQA
jgi:NADP-dependent 3-hydroxy acid dehydrogenase YdfG